MNKNETSRRLFGVLAVLLGLSIGLGVAELCLRIAGYSYPDFYEPDGALGYRIVPSSTGNYRKEGHNYVEINSDGFHDVEHALERPPEVYRIAVIGDSFVESLQVGTADMFSSFVKSEAEKCGAFDAKNVEVLTFGVSGYGTAQELLMLREKVWKYQPDLVMLLMTTNNDITDNYEPLNQRPAPYFVYLGGEFVPDDHFRTDKKWAARNSTLGRAGAWLKNNLRIVQAVGEITLALKHRYASWKEIPPAQGTASEHEPIAAPVPVAETGIDVQVYREPTDQNWKEAWHVTEGLVAMMADEVAAHNAKFVVVTGSNGAQVLPNAAERAAFARALGVDDLFYPDRRIRDFCMARSIPVITLAPALAKHAEQQNLYLHGFEGNMGYGHWNQTGHRFVGTEIGRQLCSGAVK